MLLTVWTPTISDVSRKVTIPTPAASFHICAVMKDSRASAVAAAAEAWLVAIPYTFSISGLPSNPVGRKISTSTSTPNAATSL